MMRCLHAWVSIGLCVIINQRISCSPLNLNQSKSNHGLSQIYGSLDLQIAETKHDDAVITKNDNEVGYLRKSDEKGGDGYQHFESFHDKDGDSYGYEKHEAYGKSNKGESKDGKEAGEDGHSYEVVEHQDEGKKNKNGNGGDGEKRKSYSYSRVYNDDDDNDNKNDEQSNKYSSYGDTNDSHDNYQENDDEDDEDEAVDDEEEEAHSSYSAAEGDENEEDDEDVEEEEEDKAYYKIKESEDEEKAVDEEDEADLSQEHSHKHMQLLRQNAPLKSKPIKRRNLMIGDGARYTSNINYRTGGHGASRLSLKNLVNSNLKAANQKLHQGANANYISHVDHSDKNGQKSIGAAGHAANIGKNGYETYIIHDGGKGDTAGGKAAVSNSYIQYGKIYSNLNTKTDVKVPDAKPTVTAAAPVKDDEKDEDEDEEDEEEEEEAEEENSKNNLKKNESDDETDNEENDDDDDEDDDRTKNAIKNIVNKNIPRSKESDKQKNEDDDNNDDDDEEDDDRTKNAIKNIVNKNIPRSKESDKQKNEDDDNNDDDDDDDEDEDEKDDEESDDNQSSNKIVADDDNTEIYGYEYDNDEEYNKKKNNNIRWGGDTKSSAKKYRKDSDDDYNYGNHYLYASEADADATY